MMCLELFRYRILNVSYNSTGVLDVWLFLYIYIYIYILSLSKVSLAALGGVFFCFFFVFLVDICCFFPPSQITKFSYLFAFCKKPSDEANQIYDLSK